MTTLDLIIPPRRAIVKPFPREINVSKELSGSAIVAGTAIGASMLALPFVTGAAGFWYASLGLISCYFYTMATLLLLLEVTMYCPNEDASIISMARMHLGGIGEMLTWIIFLFLLYIISTSYISGGGQLLTSLVKSVGYQIPKAWSMLIFTTLFGLVAFQGVRWLDSVNQFLTIILITSFVGLVVSIAPFISLDQLEGGSYKYIPASLSVTVAAFACHFVVPSLRKNFSNDILSLQRMLWIGASIPLFIYLVYEFLIIALFPYSGPGSLIEMAHQGDALELLQDTLLQNGATYVPIIINVFANAAILTSFLGVVLAISDFLEDGFNLKDHPNKQLICAVLSLAPPFLMALLIGPSGFTTALEYSGFLVNFLFVLLPIIMAYNARYVAKLDAAYQLPGGKTALALLTLLCMWFMYNVIANAMGWLPTI